MQVKENVSLQKLNTFGIDVKAKFFAEFHSFSDIQELLPNLNHYSKYLLLGGGSNILFTKNYDGLIIHICLKGIKIINETKNHYYINVSAGENFSDFVDYCVENNFSGLENLSLIPGDVGSAPVQNIGAYGVELKDVFYELQAVDLKSGNIKTFVKNECHFAYRNSIFKQDLKGKYLITSVTFKLKKKYIPKLKYKALSDLLKSKGITKHTIKNVSDCVKEIRRSKLPDPKKICNAGSFFKNPVIDKKQFRDLHKKYNNIPFYRKKNQYKIAAAWLIEQCGWKGKREGNAGVFDKQPLVIVNFGKATGDDILKLSQAIQKSVFKKFQVELQTEVNIY